MASDGEIARSDVDEGRGRAACHGQDDKSGDQLATKAVRREKNLRKP